ncbi:MAG: magnesium transporter, partial [Candidatus Omnitrophica bacterium]|nr:magnesium transporter [Candidatus Omnitrophota bacterium]
ELKALLSKIPSIDIAEGWHHFSDNEKIFIFKLLTRRLAVELFEYMKFADQSFLLNNLDNSEVSQVLNEMASDERADLFHDLPPKIMKRFFRLMKTEEVDDVRELMTYEKGTAGSIMTTDFVEIRKEITARAAILKLQDSLSFEHDFNLNSIYVTDINHKLLGIVELQDLIKAPADMLIKDLKENTDFIKVNELALQKEVAGLFKRYDLLEAPVVDYNDKLVGIITIDDIVDIIEQEATEDMEKMAAVLPVEKPYLDANFFNLFWKRSFWLFVLVLIESISAFVLKSNHASINSMLALTFFVPIQIAMGGNAGSQSAAIVIRSLAVGDIKVNDFFKVVLRESLLGICIGVTVAVLGSVVVSILEHNWLLSLAVGASMGITIFMAAVFGAGLPIIFRRLKLDPALMSGPMVATMVDVLGIIIYFKIAQLILPNI